MYATFKDILKHCIIYMHPAALTALLSYKGHEQVEGRCVWHPYKYQTLSYFFPCDLGHLYNQSKQWCHLHIDFLNILFRNSVQQQLCIQAAGNHSTAVISSNSGLEKIMWNVTGLHILQ